MRIASFLSYFFAGVLLTNSMPHFIVSITGRRNLTPFGRDSSAPINGLWGCINFVGGYLLVRYVDKKTGATADSKLWQLPYEAGCLFWSLFGVLYAYFSSK